MRAPSPHTVIRHHLIPPAGYVQTATAWRADLRPRRARLAYAAVLLAGIAVLGGVVALRGAGPDVVAVVGRVR